MSDEQGLDELIAEVFSNMEKAELHARANPVDSHLHYEKLAVHPGPTGWLKEDRYIWLTLELAGGGRMTQAAKKLEEKFHACGMRSMSERAIRKRYYDLDKNGMIITDSEGPWWRWI